MVHGNDIFNPATAGDGAHTITYIATAQGCSDTATNTLKPATVETGANVMIPLFVETGEKIKIDTRTGDYVERIKK